MPSTTPDLSTVTGAGSTGGGGSGAGGGAASARTDVERGGAEHERLYLHALETGLLEQLLELSLTQEILGRLIEPRVFLAFETPPPSTGMTCL